MGMETTGTTMRTMTRRMRMRMTRARMTMRETMTMRRMTTIGKIIMHSR